MNIKSLNQESSPHSKKIITEGNISFKLWLEFEETGPWEDIENDFANIAVNMLDGRRYGINVWTFKFLDSARKEEKDEGNNRYIIPPDLFVKELSRECIEQTILELLKQGDLEQVLNPSVLS